ncbi:Mitogen-activated protein kinase kinase 1 [Apostasia shenzhenica]|uniref:Mitogen-activated protein kinase kinase 1 n=1 Tax=Apostasia shenzhenica TaxID=1088818 RepID=A0A2I0BCE7_9ASPA|nr:Mitogen-activated protein kinase kinase 1 [Apostasia shenzhenica]
MERKNYPIRAEDYELYETIGQGVSACVRRALCVPLNEIVAIKILDFERHSGDLSSISREAQTMILIDHPNVLKSHCSFVEGHNLWVVMPYMAGGSCLHIMKSVFPDGFEEVVIATVLKEVLKGLEYLHHHGHIHRDVKAGNILVDAKGAVKLGDFGVSVCLFDNGDRQRSRNTFVGTPCWMAPEVMEQLHGYDFKADIWSFGITALELAHGHAPFSRYPPMKVLLMTLQNAPPGLDYARDKKFSKSFKHMIASCLVKDPSKRPSARKLLKHAFFKQARSPDYIIRKILDGLPVLGDRYQALQEKDENLLAQKKIPDGRKEEISQNEYKRGISSWNFDIEDLKSQAALVDRGSLFSRTRSDGSDTESKNSGTSDQRAGVDFQSNEVDNFSESYELETYGSPAPSVTVSRASSSSEFDEKHVDASRSCSFHERRSSTASCSVDNLSFPRGESLKQSCFPRNILNCNGEVSQTLHGSAEAMHRIPKSLASNLDDPDDKSKAPIVQQRGRFKVTSESMDFDRTSVGMHKSHSIQVSDTFAIAHSF